MRSPIFKNACNRIILIFGFVIINICTLSRCSSNEEVISLPGKWKIQKSVVWIYYYPELDTAYPPELKEFLDKSINYIESEILKPAEIIFHPYSSSRKNYPVDFSYSPYIVSGTYGQNNVYFTIFNNIYPLGISGVSDNKELNLFYTKEYLMPIFDKYIPEGEDTSYYHDFIFDMGGIALYSRSD